jgi:hypothetical protein
MKSVTMIWAGNVAHAGQINAYKFLIGKPERKRPTGET